jgi:membrane carboxypeptidase/penicillin-binding protein PbpC
MQLRKDWQIIKRQVARIQSDSEKLNISPTLVIMLIAAEDHRFGSHPGVDLISICRAIWKSLFCGRKEGGSTIAMQLVRVITGRYERTLGRKVAEIYLALRLTRHVRKADLPKLYLMVAYFGWRMNGLAQTTRRLKISPSNVSEIEAAYIVARLKYPEPRRPDENKINKIRDRTKYILSRSDALFGATPALQLNLRESNGSL